MVKRTQFVGGGVVTPTPNEVFNFNSLQRRFESGRSLSEQSDWTQSEVQHPNPYWARWGVTVTIYRFLRTTEEPGKDNLKGYWEVRQPNPDEFWEHTEGKIPKYVCTCPDHLLRLQAAPLNPVIAKKFPASWEGILRDCKHIWAVRWIRQETKLIKPLPSDIPLSQVEELQSSTFSVNSPTAINSVSRPGSINLPKFKPFKPS